jgi:hypothetical protein
MDIYYLSNFLLSETRVSLPHNRFYISVGAYLIYQICDLSCIISSYSSPVKFQNSTFFLHIFQIITDYAATTAISKANAFGETRDREGDFNDGGFLAGMSAGKAQAVIDERLGIDNDSCDINHSNEYCEGYGIGYAAEQLPFN